jgi:antitoxin component of MazEF toxin-antitoxin module
MEIKIIAKKLGNSIGIILPKEVIEINKIKENDELTIDIKKQILAKDLFGKYPRTSKKTGQEIKDEMRKGWE